MVEHDNFTRPPVDCRRILVVGAGGFGREVLQWLNHAWPDAMSRVAGFLSDDPDRLAGRRVPRPIVGRATGFAVAEGDYFVLGIGVPDARRRVAESLVEAGARFLTLVHPTAVVAPSAVIGVGAVICPFCVVSDSVSVGRWALLNYHSSVGHDASVGDYAVLSPYATLGGGALVADDVFLGLHAAVGPGVSVGARAKVSANSSALAAVPADCIVWGSPGVVRRRLDIS